MGEAANNTPKGNANFNIAILAINSNGNLISIAPIMAASSGFINVDSEPPQPETVK